MNKKEFTIHLSSRLSIPRKECSKFVNTYLELLGEELAKGDYVLFHGFGTLYPWEQTERKGRNPQNGKPYPIPKRTSVKFKPGRTLLEKLNKT